MGCKISIGRGKDFGRGICDKLVFVLPYSVDNFREPSRIAFLKTF